jgi:hypothetical protein
MAYKFEGFLGVYMIDGFLGHLFTLLENMDHNLRNT